VGVGGVPTHTIDVKALRQNKGKVIDVEVEDDEVDGEVEIEVEDEG
jgi:hypothetical protein